MSAKTGNSAPILLAVTLAMFPGLIANTAAAQSDTGIRDIPRTDTAAPVITRGSPPGTTPLETTYWKSIELAEKPTPAQGTKHALEGTSWQLVKFQGSDGATLTPDDRPKYTIAFGARGQLTARVDCNRGRGTWKSSATNQVQFGPLALTRAKCPAGSLHDHIVKQWGYIRSYVIKDGHLFLSLMADGGIYEFEPIV